MELTFVRNILGDLGYPVKAPVILCVDNKAAVDICKAMGVTKRSLSILLMLSIIFAGVIFTKKSFLYLLIPTTNVQTGLRSHWRK